MDQIKLPKGRRGDGYGPIRLGPVSPDTPLPYPLEEAKITSTFRLESIRGEVVQVLSSEEGEIVVEDGRIVIKRFRPIRSGRLVFDIELDWEEHGETITVYQTPSDSRRWVVELDSTRPEGAS